MRIFLFRRHLAVRAGHGPGRIQLSRQACVVDCLFSPARALSLIRSARVVEDEIRERRTPREPTEEAESAAEQANEGAATAPSFMYSVNRTEVKHEVAIPKDYAYVPLEDHVAPMVSAKEYAFTLDPFQKASIACLERKESVLVAAHTSAGKTVVAE
jgi:superfamily II RNA helicase